MHKYNLSNNHYLHNRIVLPAFYVTVLGLILPMIFSPGKASRMLAIDVQSESKIPGGSSKETMVSSINVKSLDGKEKVIELRGQKKATVIYVFVPGCPWSDRNFENIKKLATVRGKSYRFFGLSLSKLRLQAFAEANTVDFPIYLNSPGNARQLGLGSVPQTIVISPEGRILKSWLGAYGEDLKAEVEKYFNIRLPGLDSRGNCAYCLDDAIEGALYSPGAVIKSGDRRLRCKFDGQWSAPY